MVDQSAGLNHLAEGPQHERFTFSFGGPAISAPTQPGSSETTDYFPQKIDFDWRTDVFDDKMLDVDRRNEFLASSEILNYFDLEEYKMTDLIFRLTCPRVFGYVMRLRKWLPLNVELMQSMDNVAEERGSQGTRYDDLILPKGHKDLLQALVSSYTKARGDSSDNSDRPLTLSMDVVEGKGEGLFILLHGSPGVGKTSTAECVAAQLRRPLLPISCGDLGGDTQYMEKRLEAFCRWSSKWRCVLLLDEADLFLSKRDKGDFQRNSQIGSKNMTKPPRSLMTNVLKSS